MDLTVQGYIETAPDARKDLLLSLQDAIWRLFPEAKARISYQVVKYEVSSGWIFLGYWSQGVSLYTGIIPELAVFRIKHPRIKTGKGCINLKLTQDIPWPDIETIIRHSMER